MKNTARKSQNGFTMVEVLVSLTILAMLMAAVAFAFDASVTNFQANQGIYKTINRGRQALLRMTNDLRTTSEVALKDNFEDHAQLLQDADNSYIGLLDKNGGACWYMHEDVDTDGEKDTLYYVVDENGNLQIDEDGTDKWYTLCENVTNVTFDRTEHQIDRDNGAGGVDTIWAVRDVRIVLTITDDTGDISKKLAAATLIRKNQ